jgi:hypothetical protein
MSANDPKRTSRWPLFRTSNRTESTSAIARRPRMDDSRADFPHGPFSYGCTFQTSARCINLFVHRSRLTVTRFTAVHRAP